MNNIHDNKTKHVNCDTAREQTIRFDSDDFITQAQPPVPQAQQALAKAVSGFRFISFGSGSSGNSAYLGNDTGGVIIDAGIEADTVFDTLKHNGIAPSHIKGIVLTHDHQDHVRYVYTLVRRYKHIRIYCTPRVLNGLLRRHNISRRVKEYHESIFKEIPFTLGDFKITAFETSHDGSDNMGFDIDLGGKHFVVATDMGIITERARHYMSQANYLMIESNYDLKMLNEGHYPEYLKNRVRGERGHLDNEQAAQFISEHYHPGLTHVFMCHLSKDNNTPEIAHNTIAKALRMRELTVGDGSNAPDQRERDVQLYALPRFVPSIWFVL